MHVPFAFDNGTEASRPARVKKDSLTFHSANAFHR